MSEVVADPQSHERRVLLLASGASFLALLDVTVVNLAFPDLGRHFDGPSVTTLSWVITSYTIALAALLTPAGRLADVLGRRRVFVGGVLAFTAASVACAVAPSVWWLVAVRAVQGAAAAAMVPASLGLILSQTAPERRFAAVGLWGASAGIAAAVGPALGGVLVDLTNWRSVFLINAPLGLAIVVGARRAGIRDVPGRDRVPDLPGTAALTAGIAVVVLAVTQGTDWGWQSGRVLGLLGVGVVLVVVALARSRRHPAPALEISLWRHPMFASANAASLFFGATLYAWMLIGVLFLTTAWGYSEIEAGLAMTPGAVTSAVGSVLAGRLVGTFGHRATVVLGALLTSAVGWWLVAALTTTPEFLTTWLPAGLLCGIGFGAVLTGLSSAAATSVPPERFAAGAGLNMTARQLGGALGIAVLAAILRARSDDGAAAFTSVYAFCAVTALLAAVAALRLDGSVRSVRTPATAGAVR